MRGKASPEIVDHGFLWITPAYAGKRHAFSGLFSFLRDHPRLCGEKFLSLLANDSQYRITPAYAGKRRDQKYFW